MGMKILDTSGRSVDFDPKTRGYEDLYNLVPFTKPPYASPALCNEWQKGWIKAFRDILEGEKDVTKASR